MPTFLLNWNPTRWPWDELSHEASEVAAGTTVRRYWSTGVRKDVPVGSRLFILRQGVEPRGIVASGVAAGPPREFDHFEAEEAAVGKRVWTTPIEFDRLVDVSTASPLPRSALDAGDLGLFRWDVQGGGVQIPDAVASELERVWAAHHDETPKATFVVGATYTRFEVLARLGLPIRRGGDPFTGYFRHGNEFFLFPNIGTAGATGHDYNNGWEGDVLRWYAKAGTSLKSPSVTQMLSDDARVHVFTRHHQREPFRYEGTARPHSVEDESPALIRWAFDNRITAVATSVADLDQAQSFKEGQRHLSLVSRAEREPAARAACIKHYGAACSVCDFNFGETFGTLGEGFTHVHHLNPLGKTEAERPVDPIEDLRPVCPNCHAMLHRRDPPLAIQELVDILQARR